MGRKLNLSHLSEAECEHILNVVHKDFNIRYMEKERLRQIEEDVVEDETKYSILSKSQVFNEKHCICCFSRFLLLFNPRILCDFCKFCVCKRCIEVDEERKCRCCSACIKQRQLKRQSNEWFYSSVEKKFKRCGSAKVIRSLYKRRLIGSTDDDSRSLVIMMTHSDSHSPTTMTHPLRSIGCTGDDATDNARQRTRCGATLPKSITMATGDAATEFKRSMSADDGQGHLEDGRGSCDRSLEELGGVTSANQLNSQSAQSRDGDDDAGQSVVVVVVGDRIDSCVQTDDDDLRSGMMISSSVEMGTMTGDGVDGYGGDGCGVDGAASRSLAGFDGMSTVSTEGHETDPQFIQRPHNIRVLEAEPLIVECKVHGTEPLDVLWFCNRNQGVHQLEESDRCELRRHANASFSLTLFEMNPTKDDCLDYLCIAVNAVGQCAQGFTVAVDANAHAHVSPQFTCPSDVVEIVPEGGQAVLRCSVSAYPEPKVTWYKNNKKLTHGGRYRTDRHVPDALHYTLVIDEVKSEDSGSYVAVASNVDGRARLSLQLLVQPNVSEMTRCGSDEAAAAVADAAADLHSNEDDLMRLAEGVSRTQGRYTTTAARMLRSADTMSSMQIQLDEMDRALQDLEGEVLDVISDEDDDDDDDDEANNNNNGCRQLLDDLDDMKSSAEAVGMVTSAALQLLSSAKDLARETVQHGEEEDDDEEEEEDVEEEEGDNDEEEEEEEEDGEMLEQDEEEECVDADDLKLSYQELEKLFEVGLISRSQLRNRLVQKRDIKHIRSFLQSTMSSALKDSHGHAHPTADDQSESGSAMDTSVDSLEARDERRSQKNGNVEDGERREKTEVVAAAAAAAVAGGGEVDGGMVDNQLLKKTEEQIYLTSGKVFSLEDCIRDLEKQVLQVDDDTPTETLASLENSVAKAVAQVTQSDHEVNDIERQVSQWLKNSNKNVVVGRSNRKSTNQQQQQQLQRMGDERQTRMTMSDSETDKKRKRKKKKTTMTIGEELTTG